MDGSRVVATGILAVAGISASASPKPTRLTLTFDHAGVFPFFCTIPNHASSGMTGAVFVNP